MNKVKFFIAFVFASTPPLALLALICFMLVKDFIVGLVVVGVMLILVGYIISIQYLNNGSWKDE